MISGLDVYYALLDIAGEARRRWGGFSIVSVKETQGKVICILVVGGRRVKVIVHRRSYSIRVYSGLAGQEIALRRLLERSLRRRIGGGEVES